MPGAKDDPVPLASPAASWTPGAWATPELVADPPCRPMPGAPADPVPAGAGGVRPVPTVEAAPAPVARPAVTWRSVLAAEGAAVSCCVLRYRLRHRSEPGCGGTAEVCTTGGPWSTSTQSGSPW